MIRERDWRVMLNGWHMTLQAVVIHAGTTKDMVVVFRRVALNTLPDSFRVLMFQWLVRVVAGRACHLRSLETGRLTESHRLKPHDVNVVFVNLFGFLFFRWTMALCTTSDGVDSVSGIPRRIMP